MTRRATPTDPHVTRIEDGNPDRLRRRAEDYIARVRDAGAVVLTIKPAYESRRIVAYDVSYIAPDRITEGTDAAPNVLIEWHAPECPAPAVVATPLGLAYLLPGFEPAPVRLSEHVAQSTMF